MFGDDAGSPAPAPVCFLCFFPFNFGKVSYRCKFRPDLSPPSWLPSHFLLIFRGLPAAPHGLCLYLTASHGQLKCFPNYSWILAAGISLDPWTSLVPDSGGTTQDWQDEHWGKVMGNTGCGGSYFSIWADRWSRQNHEKNSGLLIPLSRYIRKINLFCTRILIIFINL